MNEIKIEPIDYNRDSEVLRLHNELKVKETEIEKLKQELTKASDLCQKVIRYNEHLKGLVSAKPSCHVEIQAIADEIDREGTNAVNAPVEDWVATSEKSRMSVTECVRAAAEEVTRQAGMVYDPSSGYYYDSASGYYYHPEKALYYDAKTGVFFFYNQETEKYEFHSRHDINESREIDQNAEEHQHDVFSYDQPPNSNSASVDCDISEDDIKYKDERDDGREAGCSRRSNDDSQNSSYCNRDYDHVDRTKLELRVLSESDDDAEDWDRQINEERNRREHLFSHKSHRRNDYDTISDRKRKNHTKEKCEEKFSKGERKLKHRKKSTGKNNHHHHANDSDEVVVLSDTYSREEGECSDSAQSGTLDLGYDEPDSSADIIHSDQRKRRNRTIDDIEYFVNSLEDFEHDTSKNGKESLRYVDSIYDSDQSSFPPCVRAIILKTTESSLVCGTLFLITCQGASIGRDKSCDICIPDVLISKWHAEIVYAKRNHCYAIKDHNSVNGTLLNDKMISKTNRHALEHGDIITLGTTKLLLHIHKGSETCDDCEPGQVQAALAAVNPEVKEVKFLTKEDKEKERKRELKNIRKKYGLSEDPYVVKDKMLPTNSGYTDRSEIRRIEKGSDNPYEKTETASVDVAISQDSKGFKMLEKMGWNSGQSLGKLQTGILEPIQMEGRLSKAGLGLEDENMLPRNRRKVDQWSRAFQRYKQLENNKAEEDMDS